MRVINTDIVDVKIIQPLVHGDARGFFLESFNEDVFRSNLGKNVRFVQDNHSRSERDVLRGLHYQINQTQGKLVRVVRGEIFDVAVDLRKRSPTFGKWFGTRLSAENFRQLWIAEGCAHGFLVTSDVADVLYKTTDYYSPSDERCISWCDADLEIEWPIEREPKLSDRDRQAMPFKDAEVFR
jgi:dTDP-4-dehydrorhamnose 3,5-epimerase